MPVSQEEDRGVPFSYGFLKYGKKAGTRKARGQKIAGLVTTIFLLVIRKVKPMHRRCGCRLPQRLSFQINGLSVKSLYFHENKIKKVPTYNTHVTGLAID